MPKIPASNRSGAGAPAPAVAPSVGKRVWRGVLIGLALAGAFVAYVSWKSGDAQRRDTECTTLKSELELVRLRLQTLRSKQRMEGGHGDEIANAESALRVAEQRYANSGCR